MGEGNEEGWEGCVSATGQLTSRWLWRLWFSGCPAFLFHDVILIEPGRRGSAREAGEASAPAWKPQEALGVRSSPPGWAALPDTLRQHRGSSSPEHYGSSGRARLSGSGGRRDSWLLWGGRFLPFFLSFRFLPFCWFSATKTPAQLRKNFWVSLPSWEPQGK